MDPDFQAALLSMGMDPRAMMTVLDDVDGTVILREEDVGAIIAEHAPELPISTLQGLSKAIYQGTTPIQRVYATMAGAYITQYYLRPNTEVTLYATTNGTPSAPGGPYNLFPRIGGVLQTTPFTITKYMSFLRFISNQVDITSGFSLVGPTFGLEAEKPRPLDFDISLADFLHDSPIENTIVASWVGRSPTIDKNFIAQVMLGGVTPAEFTGLTLVLYDSSCKPGNEEGWGRHLMDYDFGEVGAMLMQAAVSRPRLVQAAAAQPLQRAVLGASRPSLVSSGVGRRLGASLLGRPGIRG